jgi:hypothetical protein
MHTNHVTALLPDYVRGRLEEQVKSGVELHLAHCSACKTELDQLQMATSLIERESKSAVPAGYFNTVLPRVRTRLESNSAEYFWNPLIGKVALPLATAILAIAIFWRIPSTISTVQMENPLKSLIQSNTTEELNSLFSYESETSLWSHSDQSLLTNVLSNERFLKNQLVKEALESHPMSIFADGAELSSQQLLKNLDEVDVEEILQQLANKDII